MKRKVNTPLVLDIILTIALLTLYSKNLFGMMYHEVAGLAVVIPILIHITINFKTARGMCKNFKRVPLHIQIRLIVDILLLLTFVWMGMSGLLISKTIFTNISTNNILIKIYHMCIGGLSVILLGIHVGLHICRKAMPNKIAIVMTIVALIGGVYGIGTSDLVRWIGMPFVVAAGPAPQAGEQAMPMPAEHGMQAREAGERKTLARREDG